MQKVLVLTQATISACIDSYKAHNSFDVYELRVDCLSKRIYYKIEHFLRLLEAPVIITLRSQNQGGHFKGDYKSEILRLAQLAPAYIDVEQQYGHELIKEIKTKFPAVKIIQSCHLPDTPQQIILNKYPESDLYKLVTIAKSSLDALRVMHLARSNPDMIIHAAGDDGVVSRIFGLILQQPLIFIGGAPEASISDMLCLYKINRIESDTKILALLGNPISHSIGREFHNQHLGKMAVYVNMPLFESELKEFFNLIQGLPFYGFSITMPLKQAIKSFIDSRLAAINTLCYRAGVWKAYNTDGLGAFAAIGELSGPVLLIGAGGSAAGLAAVLKQRKVDFTLLNRSLAKAEIISPNNSYDYTNFNTFPHKTFQIVINATPNCPENLAFISEMIRPFVNKSTRYIGLDYQNSIEPNLDVQKISAQVMFYEQAELQLRLFQTAIAEDSCSLL